MHRCIDLSIHRSIDPSIYRSIDPSIHRSIDLSIHGSIYHLSIHGSTDRSIDRAIYYRVDRNTRNASAHTLANRPLIRSMPYSSFCQCRSIDSSRETEAILRNVTGRCLRWIYEKSTRTVAPMCSCVCMSHSTKWHFFPRGAANSNSIAWRQFFSCLDKSRWFAWRSFVESGLSLAN